MHKNTLFFEKKKKNLENRRSVKGSAPKPPLAPGAGGSALQTPEWLLPSPGTVIFSKAFVALTSLVTVKKDLKRT